MVQVNLMSRETAKVLFEKILGMPAEDRVLVAVAKEKYATKSGIVIPGTANEELPKKGVVVNYNISSDSNLFFYKNLYSGTVITYGLYAGKQIEPNFRDLTPEEETEVQKYDYFILSTNEILYIE